MCLRRLKSLHFISLKRDSVFSVLVTVACTRTCYFSLKVFTFLRVLLHMHGYTGYSRMTAVSGHVLC